MRRYTVRLDSFSGPLDLLLYLVKRDEVDLEHLKVSELTEQYLAFMEQVEEIDVDQASDYLVMASQLLQLKARALLPPEAREGEDGPPQDDRFTRDDLVKELLEYRRLREEAQVLEAREEDALGRFARRNEQRVEEIPLDELDVWDLVTAFQRLQEQVGAREGAVEVLEADSEPVAEYVTRLRLQLERAKDGLSFAELIGGQPSRAAMVATFLALLELVRLAEVRAAQPGPFGDIRLRLTTAKEREALRPDDALDDEERLDPGLAT